MCKSLLLFGKTCAYRVDNSAVAETAKLAVNALDGAEVQEVVSTIYASPPAVALHKNR